MIVGRDDTILYGDKYTRNVVRFGPDSIHSRNPHIPSRSLVGVAVSEDAEACSGSLSPQVE
jgi:hypothetical protein